MNSYKRIYIFNVILLIIFPVIYSLLGLGFPFLYKNMQEPALFIPEIMIKLGYYMWGMIGVISFMSFLYMLIQKKIKASLVIYGYIVFIFSAMLGLYSVMIYGIAFGTFHLS